MAKELQTAHEELLASRSENLELMRKMIELKAELVLLKMK